MTVFSLYLGLPSVWICSVVQFLSQVQLFQTPWPAAHHDPCPKLSPRVCSNSSLLSRWCYPAISPSFAPFSSCIQSSPAIRVFSNEFTLHIRLPKYWSFSFRISPSNEYSALISFRIDWFDLLAVLEIICSQMNDIVFLERGFIFASVWCLRHLII